MIFITAEDGRFLTAEDGRFIVLNKRVDLSNIKMTFTVLPNTTDFTVLDRTTDFTVISGS